MSENKVAYKSLYLKMKTSKTQLAVCPITGILISMDIPFIPNKILSYENPLSRIDNAREIAKLEYKEQSKISPHILSGVLLTILSHYELIEDHLSSTERNILLSTIPAYHLCDAMRFISTCTRRRIELFPRISLASTSTEYSQPTELLINYINVCRATLAPTMKEARETRDYISTSPSKDKSSISVSVKKRAKNLVTSLIGEEVLNPKVITLLKLVCQGDNLVTLNSTVREKLVTKLRSLSSTSSAQLADLIEDTEKEITSAERAFKQEYDEELTTLTSEMPAYGEKKSLKDILAEKLGKSSAKPSALRTEEPKSSSYEETRELETSSYEEKETEEFETSSYKEKEYKTSFKDLLDEVKEEIEEEEFQEFALEVEQTAFFDPNEF